MRLFRAGAVLVVARLGVLNAEDDVEDRTYERDKVDEYPKTALTGVVQTAETNCDARNDESNVNEPYDDLNDSAENGNAAENGADDRENDTENEGEQVVVPKFTAARTSVEISVVFL